MKNMTTNPNVQQTFNSKNFFSSFSEHPIFNKKTVSFFCDASCSKNTTIAGVAIINNQISCAFRKNTPLEDNNLAEIKAIYQTLLLAKSMHTKELVLYTDNLNAIDFLKEKAKLKPSNKHFFDIVSLIKNELASFDSFYFGWIPRKKNLIADQLSKHNFNGNFDNTKTNTVLQKMRKRNKTKTITQ